MITLTALDLETGIASRRNDGPALLTDQSQDNSECFYRITTPETLSRRIIPSVSPETAGYAASDCPTIGVPSVSQATANAGCVGR